MNDDRPSPEALLKAARAEARGSLKILLGAAPGVGKTYEMLREGAELMKGGVDVVIGVVETHGRTDTAALVAPLEQIARRAITHGAHTLDEFDLDATLARAPQVALIDEFAHTNAPGSRHPKRWQDVEELRDAGIDVITTLNVQHVESLNDVVAGFTHVRVRETVPDACLEGAEIELVDLPPDELIARLKAGKVYIPQEASRALNHFFAKANLSALRELALRRAAQVVDRQMLDQLRASGTAGNFAAGERIVVAIGDQPGGEQLVRSAKRLADAFGAEWSAVTIETPRSVRLGDGARQRIAAALQLASELGATSATIPATEVTTGLADFLTDYRATALVIGKSRRNWWFTLRHGAVVDTLARTLSGVSLHVIPMAGSPRREPAAPIPLPWPGFGAGLGAVALATVLALVLQRWIGPRPVDLLYIVPVAGVATRYGQRAALATSLLAALAYNFFFLPPLYQLTINDPQNVITFVVLTATGMLVAHLAGRLKREERIGSRIATENAAVAAFGQKLAAIADAGGTAAVVATEIHELLGAQAIVVLRQQGDIRVAAASPRNADLTVIDRAAAEWVFDRNEITGRDSRTLTASDWQFHPLSTSLGVLAVLGVSRADGSVAVTPERQLLLTTLKGQAALAFERIKLEAETRDLAALRQRDELRAALLSSIGHDLRTPLTAVVAAAHELAATQPPTPTLTTLLEESRRLRRFFDDLIEMTRIEAGALAVQMEAVDLVDAVAAAAHDLRVEIGSRKLVLDVPPSLPLVSADPRLLHHILINLVGNAAKFSPAASPITVRAKRRSDGIELTVLDEGPGLPPGSPDRLFDRFTRIAGTDRTGGSGLGLAIVRGFAEAMRLAVSAANRPEGGAEFRVCWREAGLHKEAE